MFASESFAIQQGKEVRKAADLMNGSSMNMQESPDKVEAEMKKTKSKLDELKTSERVYVLDSQSFCPPYPSIGSLIIETRYGMIRKFSMLHSELIDVDIVNNSDISSYRTFVDC